MIAFTMALLASLFMRQRVVRPLETLQRGVERIGKGDLNHQLNMKTGDEIEILADEFNEMATHLREAYTELERKVAERTQALTIANQKLAAASELKSQFLANVNHVTGDIDIHELARDIDDELWMINTRFCCLCTLDADHSFYPRWRPPFVSALAPEDRCHLNGIAMVDGRPKYVTALGETDTLAGWRANKARGGVLIDVDSNKVLLRGLSMPHSPRWYQSKLWLLESGEGSLAQVDLESRTWRTVAQLPGFTRGIDFLGPLAFIGLSQVRESAVFSGIPLIERVRERTCGVWVVNIETGQTVGFLRFESGVQEIFAVQILRGMRFPELLEWNDERLGSSYVLPDEALADVVYETSRK